MWSAMSSDTDVMQTESLDVVRARLADAGVKYVFGAYVDAHGVPKSKCVPLDHLTSMAAGSELYTVGALEGMGELGPNEDECEGHPDLRAVSVLPWDPQFAVAPADLRFHGESYANDSRRVLKRQMSAAADLGYEANAGIEPEFYVLREDGEGNLTPWLADDVYNLPTRGYDLETTILADAFTGPMVRYMTELGWDVYSFVHEGGDGQYEFEFRHTDALQMADRMIVFRLMAKHVARSLGCFASFMPKPFDDNFGSGAHVNISLSDLGTGDNLFEDPPKNGAGEYGEYSQLAYQFTAGVLRHAGAITAVACPTVNSYKRLLPIGLMNEITWAPVYQAYGHNNRTLMCRLPGNRRCTELRIADSASNFYLVLGLTIAAGLEGIVNGLDAGDPVNVDTYSVPDADLAKRGVHRLPRNLGEAIDAFESDPLAVETLGPEFHDSFVKLKRGEWEAYNTVITDWERKFYLRLW